jgi:hypothetical protein
MVTLDHFGVLKETNDAKLFAMTDDPLAFEGEPELWIPKSLIEDEDDSTVIVPEWWAVQAGLV